MKIMITTSLIAPLYMYNVMVKGHYYINETMARIHSQIRLIGIYGLGDMGSN